MPSWRKSFVGLVMSVLVAGLHLQGDDQNGRPVLRLFSSAEIQTKGPVLAFAECHDGSFLIGSNCLSAYDGRSWQTIDIPGAYAFRALEIGPAGTSATPGPERAWVGAAGALGYIERRAGGDWTYISLLPQVAAAGLPSPGPVQFLAALGHGAVFVLDQQVLRWDGRRFEGWTLPAATPLVAVRDPDNGQIWIDQPGTGLVRVTAGEAPLLVRPAATLPPGSPTWLLPAPEAPAAARGAEATSATGTGMLMGTADGVYALTATGYHFLPKLSALVHGHRPSLAVALDESAIAIGTHRNGVVVATRAGEVMAVINRGNGLTDDAVYGLWPNPRDVLWIGLGDGCALLDGIGTASVFDAHNGLDRGLPQRVFRDGDTTYVLTNQALDRLEPGADGGTRLRRVAAAEQDFRDALVNDGLWIAGAGGLLHQHPGAASDVYSAGSDITSLAPWPPGGLLYTENHSLKALVPSATDGWTALTFHFQTESRPLSLLPEAGDRLWLSTTDGVVHHLAIAAAPGAAPGWHELARFSPGHGLPATARHPVLIALGAKIFSFTDGPILVLDPVRGFVPAPEFDGWGGIAASQPAAAAPGAGPGTGTAYWAAQRLGLFANAAPSVILRVQVAADGIRWEPVQMPGLDAVGPITSLDLLRDGDDGESLWIGGNGGLLRYHAGHDKLAGIPAGLELREVRVDGRETLDWSARKPGRIGPGASRIEFSFPSPKTTGVAAVFYQTQLVGVEQTWSTPQRENTREFTGLAPGSYVFKARRMDRSGRSSPPVEFAFVVLAPWYARWPALAGEAALLGLAAGGVVRWRLRQLRRQTERLDRLVAQRTRELELSNTAKSEFLENISHEIRNPLNGIVGLVNLLQPDRLGAADRQVAQSLKASARHLRRVAEDVLGYSRIEFGGIAVDARPFSLGRTLAEVARLQAEPAERQGNRVTLTLPPAAPDRFVGDEAKIRTIVGNFLSNALKYAPGTPVEIRADWETGPGGQAQIFIAVQDQGPGVPENEQELIFQKFVRGSNRGQSGAPGTGLGLAMCRTLARRMGGTVGVESAPGRGASFHLWLPLPPAPPAGPTHVAPAGRVAATAGRALIVDDEEYNRIVLAGMTRELGFEPVEAGDGESALCAAQAQAVRLVLLDLELPGTKGDEIARRLRGLPGGNLLVIVAITAQDSDEARRRCTAAGMDGFLLKPFDVAQVRELLGQVPDRADPPAPPAPPTRAWRYRAFQLYAQGAPEKGADAVRQFQVALQDELAAIRAGAAKDDRVALATAGHRLRTLGALVGDQSVNEAARLLEERAPGLAAAELAGLVADLAGAVDHLRREIAEEFPGGPG